jgi:hypothetical protein
MSKRKKKSLSNASRVQQILHTKVKESGKDFSLNVELAHQYEGPKYVAECRHVQQIFTDATEEAVAFWRAMLPALGGPHLMCEACMAMIRNLPVTIEWIVPYLLMTDEGFKAEIKAGTMKGISPKGKRLEQEARAEQEMESKPDPLIHSPELEIPEGKETLFAFAVNSEGKVVKMFKTFVDDPRGVVVPEAIIKGFSSKFALVIRPASELKGMTLPEAARLVEAHSQFQQNIKHDLP